LVTATKNRIPLVLLFGPTGVGKTDLILDLFEGRGEIISVDSVQVYRDLNIGSAKPDRSYLDRLPHHLINICHFSEPFNSEDFVRLTGEAAENIYGRGLIPVLSGGTAFYFKNFCYPVSDTLPGENESVRKELLERAGREGLESLWQELLSVDPAYAVRIHGNDQLRIVRALEVFKLTDRPLSSFKQSSTLREGYDFCFIGLDREREELYRRIDKRVNLMFEAGLVSEVRGLIEQGADLEDPAMKAIGYREFFEMKEYGCETYADTADRIRQNSRRYAKRQMTFFKSLQRTSWFHPAERTGILLKINEFLEKYELKPLT
jgi:tRNA dimethylallyltransferase